MIAQWREVLFFASYCGNDNTACSDVRPCPTCLGMSNVYRIPAGAPIVYLRQLDPKWLANKHLEKLTARQIGKAPRVRKRALDTETMAPDTNTAGNFNGVVEGEKS